MDSMMDIGRLSELVIDEDDRKNHVRQKYALQYEKVATVDYQFESFEDMIHANRNPEQEGPEHNRAGLFRRIGQKIKKIFKGRDEEEKK